METTPIIIPTFSHLLILLIPLPQARLTPEQSNLQLMLNNGIRRTQLNILLGITIVIRMAVDKICMPINRMVYGIY